MSGHDKERRAEMRASLPAQVRFNLLDSLDHYARGNPAAGVDLFESGQSAKLEGRDDLEIFLLKLEKKIDFIISVLTENMTRKSYIYKGLLMDLSESGAKLLSPIKLNDGQLIEIGLILPNRPYRSLDIAGEVVWEKDHNNRRGECPSAMGVKFLDILSEDQDEIVHWIFQRQREEIRRSKEQNNGF